MYGALRHGIKVYRMPDFIAILEDDGSRIDAMSPWLQSLVPEFEPVFFTSAGARIDWLKAHLAEASLISLDHDLPVICVDGSEGGTGREVADYLAALPPTCPIIVH